MRSLFPLLVLGTFLVGVVGCSRSEPEETKVTEEGVDIAKNPLGALGALVDAGKDIEKYQQEIANMPAVDPVHFSELIKALPDVPSGWTADDPRGESNEMGDFKMSRANRTYTKDGGEERVEVSVEDWAYHQVLYLPFMMAARFSQETTEGYNKGIKMGEDPGREEYQTASKSGNRSVLAKKRYHVKIDVNNLPASAFDEWWPRVKVGDLPTAN